MKLSLSPSLFLAFLIVPSTLGASDRNGIYALVDRVVFEPDAENPRRMQVWGAFSLSAERNLYRPPVRGYLYFALDEGLDQRDSALCLREWSDLARVAGKGQCVTLGQRYRPLGTVRKPGAGPVKPDTYVPTWDGLRTMRSNTTYAPIRQLLALPSPKSPVAGKRFEPGPVRLVAANMLDRTHPRARYVFELENSSGEKVTSPPIAAGETMTAWTPPSAVKAGETYVWRVHAVDDKWKGPVARAEFRVREKSDVDTTR